jgi:sulfur carrier protein
VAEARPPRFRRTFLDPSTKNQTPNPKKGDELCACRGARMTIVCNGTKHEVENLSLSEILVELGYGQLMIATAVNGRFVPVRQRASVLLKKGDMLEVVAPRQGG